jgi:hypothetical protein
MKQCIFTSRGFFKVVDFGFIFIIVMGLSASQSYADGGRGPEFPFDESGVLFGSKLNLAECKSGEQKYTLQVAKYNKMIAKNERKLAKARKAGKRENVKKLNEKLRSQKKMRTTALVNETNARDICTKIESDIARLKK